MEIVTSWITLMKYAKEHGEAKRTGDKKLIDETGKRHEDYRQMCLRADRMI